jgi:hypothetical protein
MRFGAPSLFPLITLFMVSCSSNQEKTCHEVLREKKQLVSIAKSTIKKWRADPDNSSYVIWNLEEVDTNRVTYYEDHFTNPRTKNILVLMQGEAGLSAGTAHNLLMLFDCNAPAPKVLWAGQAGEFAPADVRDLNGDGIKEINIQSGMTWMGECNDLFDIINFKDNKRNFLYQAHSFSHLDCGSDNFSFSRYTVGDTLAKKIDSKILPGTNGKFRIRQIVSTVLYDGSTTLQMKKDAELPPETKIASDSIPLPRMRSSTDTFFIELK